MYKINFIYIFMLAILSTSYASARETLSLHGSDVYVDNSLSFYIAGLYLETASSNLNTILMPQTSKKMQIVITKSKWRSTGWRTHWRNGIAINNPNATDNNEALKDLVGFTSMIKGDLLKGDEITIHYNKKFTQVHLNGELVLQSQGPLLINLLLKTWLGEVPPSSQFRDNLMNGKSGVGWPANSQLLTNYKFPLNRSKIYSQWVNREQEVINADKRRIAKIRAQALVQKKKELQRKAQLALAAKRKQEAARKEKTKRKTSSATQTDLHQKKPAEKSTQDLAREKAEIQTYYHEIIEWQIQRYVDNKTEYPHWARKFSEEGFIELAFEMDKEGEIISIEDSGSMDSILAKELIRVIKVAGTSITIPQAIEEDILKLKAAYLFSLEGEKLPSPLAPVLPIALFEKMIPIADGEAFLKAYREYINTSIKKDLIYPNWAKLSRKRDEIIIDITFTRLGEVDHINIVKKAKTKQLNNTVVDNINKYAPFKVVPLEVDAETLVVQFKHTFK